MNEIDRKENAAFTHLNEIVRKETAAFAHLQPQGFPTKG